ncbi:MAG: phenylacetate--CoA ligase [Planctomycetaceae bacterium]|jgi:phenylacetate-CoA ligase|nr:phenylacetate--CoA ligase [Planctomycetaceae bacterium]
MRYFHSLAETMSLDEIRTHQDRCLLEVLRWVLAHNDYYRQRFMEAGLTRVDDFGTVEQLQELPTINKEDFRRTYPLGMCCIDKDQIREMHMSSGSTGSPVVIPYNEADLRQWAECMARCYVMAGAAPGNPVQITPSFGLFNGGFGMYHGARAAELFVIPTGSGNTERQVRLARDFETKILCGVVSYAIRILEVMRAMDVSLPNLKIGIFGAESFSEGMRKRIESELGIESFDIYGMTETGGVGTLGMDCPAHAGIHVWEDHYIVEVIDPVTGKQVPDGQQGEIVVTSLTRQALPVIRFRTGDLSKIVSREKCDCGRTHLRIAPIMGRTDDMLIVKGVNFFPKQVEHALLEIPGVLPHYQIVIEEADGVRDVRINVEADESVTGYMVEKHLKERLGFSPKGDVFKPGELPRQEGKAQRVFYTTPNNQ